MQYVYLACENFIKVSIENDFNLKKMQHFLIKTTIELELDRCGGNQSMAARKLGINRLTLRKYLKSDHDSNTDA